MNGLERRRHARYPYCRNVEFCLNCGPSGEIQVGAGVNLSDSGLCMYTFKALREGDGIEIKNKLPVPYRKAVVTWVKNYSIDLYKAGMVFLG